ncbi:MAG: hypothetical protein H0V68_01585 [Actinobacteria bacterium]|nr:hypothetical protein [Actinomycetota bacterium]
MHVDVAGRATVSLVDPDLDAASLLLALLDPYVPTDRARSDDAQVVLRAVTAPPELLELHRRAQDGLVTGWDGTLLHVLEQGKACSVPASSAGAEFAYERGFPLQSLWRRHVRFTLQLAMWPRAAVCVHGSSVLVDGRGVLVGGWSESGKTEAALALMERGGRFVSDKWTVLGSDRTIATFPITVGIRRWVLPFLPRLRACLPIRARGQFAASAAADFVTRHARRVPGRALSAPRRLAEQAVLLADRAALRPSQLLRAYGDQPTPKWDEPLGLAVVLTTVSTDEVSARKADPEWAARRFALSASYERRQYFELEERRRYSSGDRGDVSRRGVEEREEAFLLAALEGVPILEVRAPFPADPGRMADAVLQEM